MSTPHDLIKAKARRKGYHMRLFMGKELYDEFDKAVKEEANELTKTIPKKKRLN